MQEDVERVEAEHGRGEDGVVGERLEQQGGHAHGIGDQQQGGQFRAAQGEDVAPFALRRVPSEEQGAGEQEQGGEGEEGFAVLGHGVGFLGFGLGFNFVAVCVFRQPERMQVRLPENEVSAKLKQFSNRRGALSDGRGGRLRSELRVAAGSGKVQAAFVFPLPPAFSGSPNVLFTRVQAAFGAAVIRSLFKWKKTYRAI